MNIRESLQTILTDRTFLAIWVVGILLVIAVIVLGGIYIRPSDLQVPVRYSSFGITNFYRDKWYYLISMVLFAVVVAIMHTGITVRLLNTKGRPFAIAFLWITVAMLLVTAVTVFALFRVVSLSQ